MNTTVQYTIARGVTKDVLHIEPRDTKNKKLKEGRLLDKHTAWERSARKTMRFLMTPDTEMPLKEGRD